jgi:hypothetical protein
MFGLQILEVLIGLFLVYFVLSVMASGLTEVIAGLLGLRARNLAEGIKVILQDDKAALAKFYAHPAIKALAMPGKRWGIWTNRPSYIPAHLVSEVYASVKAGADSHTTKKVTKAAALYAGNELQQVERLFNDTMDRATGWYKRKVAGFVFVFAVLVVGVSNADTFTMMNTLWQNPALREGLVKLAEKQQPADDSPQTPEIGLEEATKLRAEMAQLQLLGWLDSDSTIEDPREVPEGWGWLFKIAGLGVTVGAVSMGAPFWFEKLSQLVRYRQGLTGPAPQDQPPAG